MQIPNKLLQIFRKPFYVEAYHTLFLGIGIHFLNEDNSISRDDYANDSFCFLLSYSRSIR